MADSLRDQLLKMGIANEKNVKRVDAPKQAKKTKKPSKKIDDKRHTAGGKSKDSAKRAPKKEVGPSAEELAAAALKREVKSKIKALIDGDHIAEFRGEAPFYYRVGDRIRQILLNEAVRDKIVEGQLIITRLNRVTYVITTEIADQVLALNPDWLVVRHEPGTDQPDPKDDPYSGYEVPDDLIW